MNVGDKVRVKKVDYYLCEASEGAEGEVTLTNLAGRHPIGVRLTKESPHAIEVTSLPRIYPYREEDLEVINEKLSYKPGDRVKVVRLWDDNSFATGTLFIHDCSDYGLCVQYDGGRVGFDIISKTVEVVEIIEEAKPVAKFSVGDKVFINRQGIDDARGMYYEFHGLVEGMTGVVTTVASNGHLYVAWDHPTKADKTYVRPLAVNLIVETAATPVTEAEDDATATPEARHTAVTRFVGVEVEGVGDGTRFVLMGNDVTIYDNRGNTLASMTLPQLREVMAILEGVA